MFKRVVVISFAVLVLWTCHAFTPSLKSKAQEGETRNLTIYDLPKVYEGKEPVKILKAYLGSTEIESGKDFQAPDDWTKNLNFLVKNVTDQTIKEIILIFDIAKDGHSLHGPDSEGIRIHIPWGWDYWYMKDPDPQVPERHLGPGQTALVDLGPYREMKGMNPKIVEVYLDGVVFDDTTKAWRGARYLKKNENWGWDLDPEKAHLNASRYRNQTSQN